MKEITYKQAYEELQLIVQSLENDELEVDFLAEKIKRATELVKFCKEKLRSIEIDINSELESD